MLAFRNLKHRAILASLTVLLASVIRAEAKEWRGIVPLHSSRTDVEKLLGPPTIDRLDSATYDFKAERVSFHYSKDSCTTNPNAWRVPPDTVIRIWFLPKGNSLLFSELKLDLRDYNKQQHDHVLYIFNYINQTNGIRYEVDESSGFVTLIDYFAAAEDQKLRCHRKPEVDSKRKTVRKPRVTPRRRLRQ